MMVHARRLLFALFVLFAISTPSFAQTNPYTWNAATGTWNTAANWLDGTNTAIVPPSGTTTALVFNASGSTSYTATNNIGTTTFTLNSLTVNNTGTGTVIINGAATSNTLTFAGTTPTINVTAGTVQFNGLMVGTATVTKTGAGTFIHDSNNSGFTGTLIINEGLFVNRATNTATSNFNPVSIVVNNGGTYQFGENTTGDPNLPNQTYITVNAGGTVNWQEGETFGGFHLNGGTINLQQGSVTSATATGAANQMNWTSGTLTGGAFAIGGALPIFKTTSGTVTISGSASVTTTGLFSILDGTVVHTSTSNIGSSNIALGGTTAGSTTGTFEYQGASVTRAGTFNVNDGGGVIRVTNAGSVLTLSGAFSGTGPLAKEGAGTLAITGALGQTGLTTVSAGTLRVNAVTSAGGFAVSAGTTFNINSGAATTSFSAPSVSLAAGGATLQFDINSATLPTTPLMVVSNTDGLNLNGGTHILRIVSQQSLTNGTFTAIDYSGTPITSGFTLQAGRATGSIGYDTAATAITVTITGTDTTKWTGAVNSTWDKGTLPDVGGTNNFQLVTGGTATNFIDTDITTFDDSSTVRTVNLSGTLQPAAVTVNTANTYTFQGTGSISGSASLTKEGTGTLIVATNNSNTGATTIAAGKVQVGNGGATGSLGSGGVTLADGTTLEFNRTGTLTVTGNITGTGEIIKNGAGTVTLLGSNTLTGTTTVNGGRLELNDLGGGGDLNSATIVVNNGGTFAFGGAGNPDLPGGTQIILNTGGTAEFNTGEDYGSIQLKGGAYNTRVTNNLANLSTLESGTIGMLNNTAGALAGGGDIVKTTPGTVTITGVALNNTGTLLIEEGTLSTDSALTGGPMTIGGLGTGTLQYRGATATMSRSSIALAEGGAIIDVTQAATVYTVSSVITGNSGQGGLTKIGAGTLVLTGINDYGDPTVVSAGTLLVNGQTGSNSGTGTGTVTVSGGTFGGNGRAAGAVTVTSQGTITAGTAAATRTLSLGSTLAITGGKYRVSLFGTANDQSSLIAATGAVTLSSSPSLELNLGTITADALRASGPHTYTILTGSSVSGTFNTNNFVALGFFASEWTIQYIGGNSVVLAFTPVPEPASMLLIGAVGMGAVRLVRRRRNRPMLAA